MRSRRQHAAFRAPTSLDAASRDAASRDAASRDAASGAVGSRRDAATYRAPLLAAAGAALALVGCETAEGGSDALCDPDSWGSEDRDFALVSGRASLGGTDATHTYTATQVCDGEASVVLRHSAAHALDDAELTVVLNGVTQDVMASDIDGTWVQVVDTAAYSGVEIEARVTLGEACVNYELEYVEECVGLDCTEESCGLCDGARDYDLDGFTGCADAQCMTFGGCDTTCGDPNEPNDDAPAATVFDALAAASGTATFEGTLSVIGDTAESDWIEVPLCDAGTLEWSLDYAGDDRDAPVPWRSEIGGTIDQGGTRPTSQTAWGADGSASFTDAAGTSAAFRIGRGATSTQRACVPYAFTFTLSCDG